MDKTNSNAGGLLDTASAISQNSDSVGSLAERSGSGLTQTLIAMEDLSLTVSSVAAKAGQASDMANHAVALSNKGFGLTGNEAARETIGVFKQILDAINAVNANMSEVAGVTEEQAADVQEITASVNEVGTLVQHTAKEALDSATVTKETTMSIDQISRAISEATRSVRVICDEMERFMTK